MASPGCQTAGCSQVRRRTEANPRASIATASVVAEASAPGEQGDRRRRELAEAGHGAAPIGHPRTRRIAEISAQST